LSRSVPPDSIHDIELFEAIAPAVVAPVLLSPVVAPAVEPVPLAVAPEVVPAVVAPAVAAPAVLPVPPVVVIPAGSTIALVNMYLPSAAFDRHPVTVTSCPAMAPLRCVVADVVVLCAPSEMTQLQTLATHSPVILRVIVGPPPEEVHASLCTRCASDAWTG